MLRYQAVYGFGRNAVQLDPDLLLEKCLTTVDDTKGACGIETGGTDVGIESSQHQLGSASVQTSFRTMKLDLYWRGLATALLG